MSSLVGSRTNRAFAVPKLPGYIKDAQTLWEQRRHFLGQKVPESLVAYDGTTAKIASEVQLNLHPGFEGRSATDGGESVAGEAAQDAQEEDW